jgi:hypothetical protein
MHTTLTEPADEPFSTEINKTKAATTKKSLKCLVVSLLVSFRLVYPTNIRKNFYKTLSIPQQNFINLNFTIKAELVSIHSCYLHKYENETIVSVSFRL